MVKQLLDEVRSAPLDEKGRARLAEIHQRSIAELEDGLAPELVEELERITLPFSDESPSDAELRIAQAQLVGWLEGLFHGIQTALVAQQMAAQAQLQQMRRCRPARGARRDRRRRAPAGMPQPNAPGASPGTPRAPASTSDPGVPPASEAQRVDDAVEAQGARPLDEDDGRPVELGTDGGERPVELVLADAGHPDPRTFVGCRARQLAHVAEHGDAAAADDRGYRPSARDLVVEDVVDSARRRGVRLHSMATTTTHGGRALNEGLHRYKSEFGQRHRARDL